EHQHQGRHRHDGAAAPMGKSHVPVSSTMGTALTLPHHDYGFRFHAPRRQEVRRDPAHFRNRDRHCDRDLVVLHGGAGLGHFVVDHDLEVGIAGSDVVIGQHLVHFGGNGNIGAEGEYAGPATAAGGVAQDFLDHQAAAHFEHADHDDRQQDHDEGEFDHGGGRPAERAGSYPSN